MVWSVVRMCLCDALWSVLISVMVVLCAYGVGCGVFVWLW